jgi:hypothetical protein
LLVDTAQRAEKRMADKTNGTISRRQIVGGSATLAAASLASSTTKGNEGMAVQALTNPVNKYRSRSNRSPG